MVLAPDYMGKVYFLEYWANNDTGEWIATLLIVSVF